jgi:hypothetical protein
MWSPASNPSTAAAASDAATAAVRAPSTAAAIFGPDAGASVPPPVRAFHAACRQAGEQNFAVRRRPVSFIPHRSQAAMIRG